MKIDTISFDDYFDRIPDVINKKWSITLTAKVVKTNIFIRNTPIVS